MEVNSKDYIFTYMYIRPMYTNKNWKKIIRMLRSIDIYILVIYISYIPCFSFYQNRSLLTLKYPDITFPPVFLMPSIRKHHVEPKAPIKKSESVAIKKFTSG